MHVGSITNTRPPELNHIPTMTFCTELLQSVEQVLNPQNGVSYNHSFKLKHMYIAPKVNFLRSESSNISFVILDKLLFGFSKG